MDRYCPECNSTMTPSLVGYLCVNCGHAQRFYSAQESALANPSNILPAHSASNHSHIDNSHKTANHKQHKKTKPDNKVKSTLKRLLVPELAPPHHHLIGENEDNIKPVLADKIEDEQVMPAMIATTPDTLKATAPKNVAITESPAPPDLPTSVETAPNQSSNLSDLESALHPQRNTSIWVMLGIAVLMLVVAAAVLFLIILS